MGLARRCFWQLGYEVNFLWRLEVCQMITSVIAQLGFRRGRACFYAKAPPRWINSATRARVVAAKIVGHVADPRYIVARASRGEHGCGETPAQSRTSGRGSKIWCERVEDQFKLATRILLRSQIGFLPVVLIAQAASCVSITLPDFIVNANYSFICYTMERQKSFRGPLAMSESVG